MSEFSGEIVVQLSSDLANVSNETDQIEVLQEKTDTNGSNVRKTRGTKQRGSEYEYFEFTPANRVRCKLCSNTEMLPHVGRMRYHLMFKCTGNVPGHVKEMYGSFKVNHNKAEITKKASGKSKARDSDGSDGGVEDESELAVRTIDQSTLSSCKRQKPSAQRDSAKEQVMQLLEQLLNSSDSTNGSRKKPAGQYSEEDFKREERELNIERMRLEVQYLKNKLGVMSKVEEVLNKASTALDFYVAEKGSEPQTSSHADAAHADNIVELNELRQLREETIHFLEHSSVLSPKQVKVVTLSSEKLLIEVTLNRTGNNDQPTIVNTDQDFASEMA
ncbi:hypothetical protein HDE_03873 [Halotydeus destructor]|nr:hypothetical protein HDE_03873 [Halotydeus destructor]